MPQIQASSSAATETSPASQQTPPPQEITQAVEAAKAARRFQDAADALKREAALARDPVERERLWQAAYLKEKEAHGESRKARFMASGWGQGAGFAVGISSAVGMGLGNLVGALLSGVVAVPGILVGSGVGALHGPWYKLKDAIAGDNGKGKKDGDGDGDGDGDDDQTDAESSDDIQTHMAIVEAARKMEEEEEAAGKGIGGGEKQDGLSKPGEKTRDTQEDVQREKDDVPEQQHKESKKAMENKEYKQKEEQKPKKHDISVQQREENKGQVGGIHTEESKAAVPCRDDEGTDK